METAKLSQKYQIVVPREVRRKMKLHAGMRLAVYPVDERKALLLKHPENYAAGLRGLGKEVWRTLGGAASYIKKERGSWDRKSASTR
jgi:AbrB family looped-hinge helix DNA binding protein